MAFLRADEKTANTIFFFTNLNYIKALIRVQTKVKYEDVTR